MKSRYFIIAVIATIAMLLWLTRSNHVRRMQAQRDAIYQGELQQFQRGLRLGAPRSEVMSYLHSHQIAYSTINRNLDVKIGEDPSDSIFCEKWDVFVEMSFTQQKGQIDTSPLDNLDGISIRRIGTCL
jgi:hypothetical protein